MVKWETASVGGHSEREGGTRKQFVTIGKFLDFLVMGKSIASVGHRGTIFNLAPWNHVTRRGIVSAPLTTIGACRFLWELAPPSYLWSPPFPPPPLSPHQNHDNSLYLLARAFLRKYLRPESPHSIEATANLLGVSHPFIVDVVYSGLIFNVHQVKKYCLVDTKHMSLNKSVASCHPINYYFYLKW